MSSNTLARACTWCKHDKKGCDLQRPCKRCSDRGRTVDECIESAIPQPPPPKPKASTKKRAASAAKGSPAKKRAKKQADEEESAVEAEDQAGENQEGEEDSGGEEDTTGDDQPERELIWREGDPGLAYDAWVEVEDDEEDEEESAAGGENDTTQTEPAATVDEIPYYPVTTYSALAGRGFRMPVKTKQSVASLAEEDE